MIFPRHVSKAGLPKQPTECLHACMVPPWEVVDGGSLPRYEVTEILGDARPNRDDVMIDSQFIKPGTSIASHGVTVTSI